MGTQTMGKFMTSKQLAVKNEHLKKMLERNQGNG